LMRELAESVPNFSTSDPETVREILGVMTRVKGILLLDHSYDDYYNRLIVTVAGQSSPRASGLAGCGEGCGTHRHEETQRTAP